MYLTKRRKLPIIDKDGKLKFSFFPHDDVQRVEGLDVDEVALVKKPANKRPFLSIKFNKINKEEHADDDGNEEVEVETEETDGQEVGLLTIPEFRKRVLEQVNRLLLEINNATNIPDLQQVVNNSISRFQDLASAEADTDEEEAETEEPDNENADENIIEEERIAQEQVEALEEGLDILFPPAS